MMQRSAAERDKTDGAGTPRDVIAPEAEVGSSQRGVIWTALLIAATVVLTYSNSFPGAFYFDDDAAIVQNASIRDLTAWRKVLWPPIHAGIGGRPFANLTYALNHAVGGYNPWGYRAVNVGIHAAAALCLFGLVRRTLLRPVMRQRFGHAATALAAVVALLWALHPVHTNVVNYMSQRTEGLMGALYLLTLYAFVRSVEDSSRRWMVLAFAACALGMATKEVMVTVPLMAVLYDRTFLSGSFAAALRRNYGKHLSLAATWLLLGALMYSSSLTERGVGFGLGPTGYQYALTEIQSVVRYLTLSFWPTPLIFDNGPNFVRGLGEVYPSAIVLVLALAGTVLALKRRPVVGFACAWFFILLSPSSSVIPVVQQPYAENRMYLPLVGACALLGVAAHRVLGRRALVGLAVAAVALGTATLARNPAFQSELSIWWDAVARKPTNARAQNNLANALLKMGRNEEAMPFVDRAIQLTPTYADAHNNRGVVLLRRGQLQEAVAEFEAAMKYKVNYADAQYNLGEAYLQMGRPADAIVALEAAMKISPNNPKVHNNLGIALLDTGRVQESIAAERRALELLPTMPEAHYNLGNALARVGQTAEALAEYDTALRHNPRFARAHNNAGVLLLKMGRRAEARARFEAALRIDPNYPEAQRNLALVGESEKSESESESESGRANREKKKK